MNYTENVKDIDVDFDDSMIKYLSIEYCIAHLSAIVDEKSNKKTAGNINKSLFNYRKLLRKFENNRLNQHRDRF